MLFSIAILKMPVYIKNKEKVLFIHIPKAGGSSYERIMKKNGWREELKVSGLALDDIDFMKVSPQHYHAEIIENLLNIEKLNKVLTIIRNPFDRFKSEFYWQCSQGLTSARPSEWAYRVIDEYYKNPVAYDNHIRPQSDFIVEGCNIFVLEAQGVENAIKYSDQRTGAFWYKGGNRSGIFNRSKKEKLSMKRPHIDDEFESLRYFIEEFYSEDIDIYNRALGA